MTSENIKHPLRSGIACAVAILLAVLFVICERDSGMEPAAGSVVTIFQTDNTTPAANAIITFYHVDEPACCPATLLVTDKNGSFSTDAIESGIYSMWVEHDSGVCFQDSVIITGDFTTLCSDTLEFPASVAGVVRVEPLHDPRMFSIQALGAGRHVAKIDDNGFFTLPGLAGGTWTLLISTPQQEYLPSYHTFAVSAGATDTISDTLRPAFTGLPAIPIASTGQDTAAGTVTITWSAPSGTTQREYVIYRDTCGRISMSGEIAGVTTDTFFIDTAFASLPVDHRDTLFRCFTYRIAARGPDGTTGPAWGSDHIAFAPKSLVAPVFFDSVRHAVVPSRIASINDTVVVYVSARSRTRALRSLFWYDPYRRDTIRTEAIDDLVPKTYATTLRYAFTAIGSHPLHAIVVDEAGSCWTDTITVTIIADIPVVFAGNDTGVFTGEQAKLRGSASRKFGTITGWKWKIGSDEWRKTDGPEIAFTAPDTEAIVTCSLKVSDDDGNTAVDEVRVISSVRCSAVTAGDNNSFFFMADGSLRGCGINWIGQLGFSPDQGYAHATPVTLMDNVKKVDNSASRTLFLLNDGTLLRAGHFPLDSYGFDYLPEGTTHPVTIAGNVQTMACSPYHDLVLFAGGTLAGSGINTCGQFSDVSVFTSDTLTPFAHNVIDAGAGSGFSIYLTTDHAVYLCGSFTCDAGTNNYGYPDTAGMHWPPVEIMRDVRKIAAGNNFCMMLKEDGTLWGAGTNDFGQLGDEIADLRTTPFMLMSGVTDMSLGSGFSLILKNDGTLMGCGENSSGQLGNGTMYTTPTPITIAADVKSMAAGLQFTLILKKDGSVWACGANDSGQLGDGTIYSHTSPTRVIPPSIIPDSEVAP